ncbi:glycosyltransferase family 4 protein [Oceanibium sediminis]|uniref:glycosyltransferase family 4 protein n=1 Tax=Oceanibium sediminis TaxID=2026339 RepID=UPI000DD4035D|nr:glycosyltransferase family 4 protein [Oceanibium sediminis]
MVKQADRVVLLNDFSVARGGATTLALSLAGRLARRGVPVTYFTGDTPEGPVAEGVETVAIGSDALLKRGPVRAAATGLHNRHSAARLRAWIAAHDTPGTVYHVHGWSQILSPSIFGALGPVRARVVIHAHDYFLACPNGVYYDFRSGENCDRTPLSAGCIARNCDKRSYGHKLFRVARGTSLAVNIGKLQDRPQIIVLHEKMRPLLARAGYDGAVHTVSNPATPFTAQPVDAARNRVFFYVGQLLSYKGILEFATAVERSGVRAEILGTGEEADKLPALCPSARLHGWTSRADLGRILTRARAIVVPSRGMESYGMVVAEAVTSGIPVIISDAMNLAGEVTSRGMGVAFRAGDAADLAQTLVRVAGDDALVRDMSTAAAARGWEITHTPEAWVDGICAIYAHALEEAA